MDEEDLRGLQDGLAHILEKIKNDYGGALGRFHATGKLPIGLKRLLVRFFQLFDESCRAYIAYRYNDHGESRKVQCRMGCFYCCYQTPYGISTIEYLYLYEGICRTDRFRLFLPALLDRCERLSLDFLESILPGELQPSEDLILANYSKKLIPCPFLDKTSKLCLIDDFRPLVCRMHVSFSPPRFCHPLHREPWRCGGTNIEPSPVVKKAIEMLDEVFPFSISPFFTMGIVEFMVNIARCRPIQWEPDINH
jgi:Fe-S-cluster containining protein